MPLIVEMATTDMSMALLLRRRILWMNGQGYNIRGLCADGPYAAKLRCQDFPVDTLPIARELSPLKDLLSIFILRRYFKRARPAIVFTHTPKAGIIGPIAARLAGVPMVIHVVHGYFVHDHAPFVHRTLGWLMEKWTACWAHCSLSQSREDVTNARRYGITHRIKYLGNGVDVARFNPGLFAQDKRNELRSKIGIAKDKFVFGFVGRLVKEKGWRELTWTIRQILSERQDVHFLLIGPFEKEQNDAVASGEMDALTRNPAVTHIPFVEKMEEMYAVMDAFILPTYREGVPRALMEACAMELPVIATRIRGCREVVVENETGLLVEPHSREELHDAVRCLLAMGEGRRKELGRKARERVEREFNEQRIMRRFRLFCYLLLKKNIR